MSFWSQSMTLWPHCTCCIDTFGVICKLHSDVWFMCSLWCVLTVVCCFMISKQVVSTHCYEVWSHVQTHNFRVEWGCSLEIQVFNKCSIIYRMLSYYVTSRSFLWFLLSLFSWWASDCKSQLLLVHFRRTSELLSRTAAQLSAVPGKSAEEVYLKMMWDQSLCYCGQLYFIVMV